MLTNDNELVGRFMSAGADLLNDAVRHARADYPEDVETLQKVLRAGGMTRISVTLGMTGVAWIQCEVIEPGGTAHSLATLELRRALAS